jgi:hypothetical protein
MRNFPKLAWLAWPHRTHHLSIVEAAAAASPPEAARGVVLARMVVTRIGRECGGIPVGSVAVERVVPVGLRQDPVEAVQGVNCYLRVAILSLCTVSEPHRS